MPNLLEKFLDFYLRMFSQCHEHHHIVERARRQGQWPIVIFAVGQDAEEVGLAGQRALPVRDNHLDAVGHDTRGEIVPSLVFAPSPALVHMMLGELRKLSAVRV